VTPPEWSLWVGGAPATFATRGEQPWKAQLVAQIPRPSLDGAEAGVRLDFVVQYLAPAGHPLDVDNLCEPVFSVLVNKCRWFGGSRSRMRWWRATKREGSPTGCRVAVLTELRPKLQDGAPLWDAMYDGPPATCGSSPELAEWAQWERKNHGLPALSDPCTLYVGFASDHPNLGDIATGPVKSCIDCLFPILGGTPSHPDDHCIFDLIVEKSVPGLAGQQIAFKLWSDAAVPAVRPEKTPAIEPAPPARTLPDEAPLLVPGRNPCRRGSRKWVVCEAALQGLSVTETRNQLEHVARGAGARLSEYISDLRNENGLDIRIEGDRIRYHGRL